MHEAPFRRMRLLADVVADELMKDIPDSFAFFGYSMGATLAFEVARRLHALGVGPKLLVVAACRPPHLEERKDARISYKLPDAELIERLGELHGTPEEVLLSEETMQVILPYIRADLEMVETYKYLPGDRLGCPLIVLGGRDDTRVSLQDLDRWREQTTRECCVHIIPGNHLFLLKSWTTIRDLVFPQLRQVLCPAHEIEMNAE